MTATLHPGLGEPTPPVPNGLLSPLLTRDLADLNAHFLELGTSPGVEGDPRFGWSEPIRRRLIDTDLATRARIASAPFSLFDLVLPLDGAPGSRARVEDRQPSGAPALLQARCETFVYQAIAFARRLADLEPMALRFVLQLPDDAQRWLAECRIAQLAEAAADPRIIRPRWRVHARFWDVLAGAARRGTPAALQWSHCIGLCLLGATDGAVASLPGRRRPRR